MDTPKENQHFVPKFYLKKFSNSNDEKSIGVFLKNRQKCIRTASIEGQAQKPFYYGKDGKVEDYLMGIEGHASIVLAKICELQKITEDPFDDYFRILHFAINLYMRNPSQATTLKGADKSFNKHFSKFDSSPEINSLVSSELTNEQAILFSVLQSTRLSKICLDLKIKLLTNKTSKPFITSDNPTIKYNSISENYEWLTSSFVSSGLQIFLPLSPTLMLFFYDPKTYNVKTDINEIIIVEKESEVFQLNLLQVLNSTNCLYFNENILESDISALITTSKNYSLPNQIKPIEFGSYFFQTISELKIKLVLDAVRPLTEQLIIPTNKLIFPMRKHAQKMREYIEKEEDVR